METSVDTPIRPRASAQLEAAILEHIALENEIATLEEQLKEKKARAKFVGENELVEIVTDEEREQGVTLSNGDEYTFERDMKCGILKAEKPTAFNYLTQKGAGGLLKRHLIISFGKDSAKQVATVRAMLAQVLPQFEIGIKVGRAPGELVDAVKEILTKAELLPTVTIEEELELPGATLGAFVRKEMKAGRQLPECFGVYAPLRAIKVEPATEPTDV